MKNQQHRLAETSTGDHEDPDLRNPYPPMKIKGTVWKNADTPKMIDTQVLIVVEKMLSALPRNDRPTLIRAIAETIEHVRGVERERCANLIKEIFGDQDGGLADRIRNGE